MIVTEFLLDRFLGGNPLRVLDLGNGLNVALVRSPAGRAQLLNVVPMALCGPSRFFWHGDREPFAHDTCGVVVVRTDRGVFRILRDAVDDPCEVEGADGARFDASMLNEILDGIGLREYRDVFTFNLDRLTRLVEKPARSVSQLVKLARQLHQFDKPVSSTPLPPMERPLWDLTSVTAALDGLHHCLQEQSTVVPPESDHPPGTLDRERLARELKKVDAAITDLQSKSDYLQNEINETQCALAVQRMRQRLAAVTREMAEIAEPATTPIISDVHQGTVERLGLKIAECKQQLKQLTQERDDLARQASQRTREDRIGNHAPQIEAILLHEKSALKDAESIDRLRIKLEDLETRLESQRRDLQDANELRSSALKSDTRAAARLDALAERLREAERNQDASEQRLTQAEALALGGSFAAHDTISASATPESSTALQQAETRVWELRERLNREGNLEPLQAERTAVIDELRYLHQGQLLPPQTIIMLGLPFVAGVAMVIYGLTQYQPHANWRLVASGLIVAGAVSVIKLMLDRDRAEILQRTRLRLDQLDEELSRLEGSDETFHDREMLQARLIEAERELAAVQSRWSSRSSWETPTTRTSEGLTVESARTQLQDAQRRCREINQQWRELMVDLGLPPTVTPTLAREALAQRAVQGSSTSDSPSGQLEVQLAAARAELEARLDWQSSTTGKLKQLLKDVGLPSGGSIQEQFETLRDAFREHSERHISRRKLSRELKRIRERARQLQVAGRRHAAQRQQLLFEVAHTKQQHQFQIDSRAQHRRLLQQQRELIEQEIEETQQRYRVELKANLVEQSGEELTTRLNGQIDKLTNLREQYLRQFEHRGRLRSLLSSDDDSSPPHDPLPWDRVFEGVQRVRQALTELGHIAPLASSTSHPTRVTATYLDKAAEYLAQISDGHFTGLELTADHRQLMVIDQKDQAAQIDDVNPNHYGTIFFSLWLARIEAYAERGVKLPIVLEDPLESTRPPRRGVVAQLLAQFAARGHQLILVTSHPANAREFARLGVPIADFSRREAHTADDDPAPVERPDDINAVPDVGQPVP